MHSEISVNNDDLLQLPLTDAVSLCTLHKHRHDAGLERPARQLL